MHPSQVTVDAGAALATAPEAAPVAAPQGDAQPPADDDDDDDTATLHAGGDQGNLDDMIANGEIEVMDDPN